jgi:hypothetical protein
VFVADLVDIKCMKQNSELDVIHWEILLKLVSYMKKLWRCESLFEIIKTKVPPTLVWVLYFHIALLLELHLTYKTLGGENS